MRMYIKVILLFATILFLGCSEVKKLTATSKILVFSGTKGFRHESIADGKKVFLKIGSEKKWTVDTTENASVFTDSDLKHYGAVIFLNTTGNILNEEQQNAFQKYIRSGGGFVGIHAAADTEYDWPWYNNLVGGYFQSHPNPQTALYNVENKNHPAVSFMPDSFRRHEEIYNFKSFKKELVNVLITVDERSYSGGKMGSYHPIAWYHTYDGGRAFYTAWGHDAKAFKEPLFLQHITAAINWALSR